MLLKVEKFVGIAPKIAPHLLPQNAGVIASNCDVTSGALLIRLDQQILQLQVDQAAGRKLGVEPAVVALFLELVDDVVDLPVVETGGFPDVGHAHAFGVFCDDGRHRIDGRGLAFLDGGFAR